MNTKRHYTAPECDFMFDEENLILCASTNLDPILEDDSDIVWED